ncbi:MAG: hypothetical protein VX640_04055 [Pseudomonadota bacterium]|nr:hypothetical protein [Pseudomonadota bacterium]
MRAAIAFAALALSLSPAAAGAAGHDADLAAFRTEFFARDAAYSPEARAEAERRLAALEADSAALSNAAFELALAGVVALADNGHTYYAIDDWPARFARLPLTLIVLDGKLYVGAAAGGDADLAGAEVLRIEGERWPKVEKALAPYQGGIDARKRQKLPFFLEAPEIMQAAKLARRGDSLELAGRRADGKKFRRRIASVPADAAAAEAAATPRLLTLAAARADAPLYLQEPALLYRLRRLDGDIAYVQFRANAGRSPDGEGAVAFSKRVIADLEAAPPRQVILDQRFNGGGDLNNTRDLMQALPGLVAEGGKVWTIVSGKTFSAGISSVGYLKQAGGDRVVIVGEPVGDRLEFWAEGRFIELPESGAQILFATERHNYMTGCQEDDCHGSIKRHPIRVSTLDPDYPVTLTYADFAAGRDPAMEKVMALIGGE